MPNTLNDKVAIVTGAGRDGQRTTLEQQVAGPSLAAPARTHPTIDRPLGNPRACPLPAEQWNSYEVTL